MNCIDDEIYKLMLNHLHKNLIKMVDEYVHPIPIIIKTRYKDEDPTYFLGALLKGNKYGYDVNHEYRQIYKPIIQDYVKFEDIDNFNLNIKEIYYEYKYEKTYKSDLYMWIGKLKNNKYFYFTYSRIIKKTRDVFDIKLYATSYLNNLIKYGLNKKVRDNFIKLQNK
jgi:hypothetical protein